MTASAPRPFSEMRELGLLWLINTTVFHPRGFALCLHADDDGTVTGWGMQGDGTEPWHFDDPPDMDPADPRSIDSKFAAAEAFLNSHRHPWLKVHRELTDEEVADLKAKWLATYGKPKTDPATE